MMLLNVTIIVRGRRKRIILKPENELELFVYTKILNRLLSCKTPEEIDKILDHM